MTIYPDSHDSGSFRRNPLRVLHVGSFSGNIGDNASHVGTHRLLREALGVEIDFEFLEIRRTYRNYVGPDRWSFDESFLALVNEFDLTLIGGGNYFELWLEDSATGTTIDLDPRMLERLKRPLVFNALGCDPYKGSSPSTVERFYKFLEVATSHPLIALSVRNDGSLKSISQMFGESMARKVANIPDPGFFVEALSGQSETMGIEGDHWIVNLASDMPELRFPSGTRSGDRSSYESFVASVAELLAGQMDIHTEVDLIFMPHIFSDLSVVADVLDHLPDPLRRNRVSVAPYATGEKAARTAFGLYESASLVLGMRFHANVCPIGMGVPTIGLASYRKLADVYEELGLESRCVWTHDSTFPEAVAELIYSTGSDEAALRTRYASIGRDLLETATGFYQNLRPLIEQGGIG